jgi:hypothetical protein
MHNEVVGPDQEDKHIDGQDPQHQNQDGVCVVVEIQMRSGSCFLGMPLCPHACGQLHNAGNHVGELVWNDGGHKDQKNCSVNDASSRRWGAEDREISPILSSNVARLAVRSSVYPGEDVHEGKGEVVDKHTDAYTNETKHRDEEPEECILRPK